MSYITDAVIVVDYAAAETHLLLIQPIASDTERGQSFHEISADEAGGVKVFCSHVYAAAFNYLGTNELEEWFAAIPWKSCDHAVLTARTESEYGLVMVVADGQVGVRIDEAEDYMSGKTKITQR